MYSIDDLSTVPASRMAEITAAHEAAAKEQMLLFMEMGLRFFKEEDSDGVQYWTTHLHDMPALLLYDEEPELFPTFKEVSAEEYRSNELMAEHRLQEVAFYLFEKWEREFDSLRWNDDGEAFLPDGSRYDLGLLPVKVSVPANPDGFPF